MEEFFDKKFYEKLYDTYPKYDKTYEVLNQHRRVSRHKSLQAENEDVPLYDKTVSEEWNEFKQYLNSKEFLDNFSTYTGVKVNKVYSATFIANTKGDFQLPHIDWDGKYPNKLQLLIYFSKNWQKGDPGGTYICTDEDESSIIFEPYNLDNSMLCFEETLKSWHGTRYIVKDVVRQAVGIGLT